MPTMKIRAAVGHFNAVGKHLGETMHLMIVNATAGTDGALRPVYNDIDSVLSSNNKKKGATWQMMSYAILETQHDNALNEIS
jgi:hypothetical protein